MNLHKKRLESILFIVSGVFLAFIVGVVSNIVYV